MLKAAALAVLGAAAVNAQVNCALQDTRINFTAAGLPGFTPPTLINNNVDLNISESVIETGIRGTDLEIGFTIDSGVYHSEQYTLTTLAGDDVLNPAAINGSLDSNVYANPTFYFVAQEAVNGFAIDQKITGVVGGVDYSQCEFVTTGAHVDSSAEGSSVGQNFASVNRTGAAGDASDAVLGDCGNDVVLSGKINFRRALRECGWTTTADKSVNPLNTNPTFDPLDTNPNVVDNGDDPRTTDYTEFLGKLKVTQTRYGGLVRLREAIRVEDFGFEITVLYPNNLRVASSNVTVTGVVAIEAAVTHQIWNSGATPATGFAEFGDVDLNILVGSTFPYAQSVIETTGLPTLTLRAADTPSCTPYAEIGTTGVFTGFLATTDTDFDSVCRVGGVAGGAVLQTQDLYNEGILCDANGNNVCDIADFFEAPSDTDFFAPALRSSDDVQGGFGGFVDSTDYGAYPLPLTRCTHQNLGTRNEKACLQNIWATLRPRNGWCDLNVALTLTLNAVCRNDNNGDGAQQGDESFARTTGSTNDALDQTLTGQGLIDDLGGVYNCPAASAIPDRESTLNFTLASDNFCPRVIATGDTSETLELYESEGGSATWGARVADVTADTTADWTADATETNSATSADCPTPGAATADPSWTLDTDSVLCRQVPNLYPVSASPTLDNQRKIQDEFVFGTSVYGEVNVVADAGVNIADASLDELWITSNTVSRDTDPETPPFTINDARVADWSKQLVDGGAVATTALNAYDGTASAAPSASVEISQDIVANSMIRIASANTIGNTAGNIAFFDTNAAAADANSAGHPASRVGTTFQGTSRFRVIMNKHTVQIQDTAEEAPENVRFHAEIAVSYIAANAQGTLGGRAVSVSSKAPSSLGSRARMMASPAIAGGNSVATAGVRPAAGAGSASASSTLTVTLLAVAAVFGVVAAVAAVGFMVVRKKKVAARSAKRSSSSMEMNDTAQVQV